MSGTNINELKYESGDEDIMSSDQDPYSPHMTAVNLKE